MVMFLRRVLDFEVVGKKRAWETKNDVEKHTDQIGQRKRKMPLTERSGTMMCTNCQETLGESGHLH